MSVSYKREINHNYLIIESTEQAAAGYECRMLAGNTIEGLLKFRVRHHEERKDFYYEITSKQPLSRILEQRMISGNEIRALMLGIAGVVGKLEEYLLNEDQIFLEPDYIYIEPDRFLVFLCVVPGYSCNFPAALTALFEYLLSKVNHQDKEGVILAYNLYHESLKENYGMQDLLGFLSVKSSRIFEEERPFDGQERLNTNGEEQELENDRQGQAYDSRPEPVQVNRLTEASADSKQDYIKPETVIKTTGSRFMKILLRFLGVSVAGMIAIWFLAGLEGLRQYGSWWMGGVFVLSGIIEVADVVFMSKSKVNTNLSKEIKEDIFTGKEEKFKIVQKEEKAEYWTDWKESDKMELAAEPQTALLADLEKPERFATLEGLNREQGVIEITYLPFVIGKSEELSDYCLHQSTVSRLHLRIDKKENVFIVTDLNSTNGTIVEGYHLQANETVSIKNGDIIYLADAGFRFVENKM